MKEDIYLKQKIKDISNIKFRQIAIGQFGRYLYTARRYPIGLSLCTGMETNVPIDIREAKSLLS